MQNVLDKNYAFRRHNDDLCGAASEYPAEMQEVVCLISVQMFV